MSSFVRQRWIALCTACAVTIGCLLTIVHPVVHATASGQSELHAQDRTPATLSVAAKHQVADPYSSDLVFASNRNCSDRPDPTQLHTHCIRSFRSPATPDVALSSSRVEPVAYHAELAQRWNVRRQHLRQLRAPPDAPLRTGPAFRDMFRTTQSLLT